MTKSLYLPGQQGLVEFKSVTVCAPAGLFFFSPPPQTVLMCFFQQETLSLATWLVLGMDETGSNNCRSSSMIWCGYSELLDQNSLQTAMDTLLKWYRSPFPSIVIKAIFTYPFFLSTIISPGYKANLLHHSPSPATNFSLLVQIFRLALSIFVKKCQFISTCLIIWVFLISRKKRKENKDFCLLQSSSFIHITRPF